MTLDQMRTRMNEYFSKFTPESFCKMLEEKYGLKEIVRFEKGVVSEGLPMSTPSYNGGNSLFSDNDESYGVAA